MNQYILNNLKSKSDINLYTATRYLNNKDIHISQ